MSAGCDLFLAWASLSGVPNLRCSSVQPQKTSDILSLYKWLKRIAILCMKEKIITCKRKVRVVSRLIFSNVFIKKYMLGLGTTMEWCRKTSQPMGIQRVYELKISRRSEACSPDSLIGVAPDCSVFCPNLTCRPGHSLLVGVSGGASGQPCMHCLRAGFGFRRALGGGEVRGSSTRLGRAARLLNERRKKLARPVSGRPPVM